MLCLWFRTWNSRDAKKPATGKHQQPICIPILPVNSRWWPNEPNFLQLEWAVNPGNAKPIHSVANWSHSIKGGSKGRIKRSYVEACTSSGKRIRPTGSTRDKTNLLLISTRGKTIRTSELHELGLRLIETGHSRLHSLKQCKFTLIYCTECKCCSYGQNCLRKSLGSFTVETKTKKLSL